MLRVQSSAWHRQRLGCLRVFLGLPSLHSHEGEHGVVMSGRGGNRPWFFCLLGHSLEGSRNGVEGEEVLWVCAQGAASPSGQFGSSLCIPGMDMEAEEKGEWSREVRMLQPPEAEGCLWPQDS